MLLQFPDIHFDNQLTIIGGFETNNTKLYVLYTYLEIKLFLCTQR